MIDFGNRLKNLRLEKKYTQQQLSERLGITKSVVSAYENGVRMPSYDVLISISRIFNVTTDYLLGVEKNDNIDFSGLSDKEISAIKTLIANLKL